MAIASTNGFIGGSNAAPEIAMFPMAFTSRGGQGFLTGATAQVLDANSPYSITIASPASAITQDLPSTGVLAGRQFLLQVTGATEANYVALRSSGGNEIDRIGGAGFILVEAQIDTPTSAAHWKVLDVYESITGILATPTGANTSQMTIDASRRNIHVTINVRQNNAAAVAAANITAPAGTMPARFRPAENKLAGTSVQDNNAYRAGMVVVIIDGSLVFYKYDGANFSGVTSVGNGTSAESTFSFIK